MSAPRGMALARSRFDVTWRSVIHSTAVLGSGLERVWAARRIRSAVEARGGTVESESESEVRFYDAPRNRIGGVATIIKNRDGIEVRVEADLTIELISFSAIVVGAIAAYLYGGAEFSFVLIATAAIGAACGQRLLRARRLVREISTAGVDLGEGAD